MNSSSLTTKLLLYDTMFFTASASSESDFNSSVSNELLTEKRYLTDADNVSLALSKVRWCVITNEMEIDISYLPHT